jgi:hypothetical protein
MAAQDVPATPKPIHVYAYRGKVLVMWNAADFL